MTTQRTLDNMRNSAWLASMTIALVSFGFGQSQQKTSTYTSSNGDFRFVYPTDSTLCTRGKIDSCNQSFIPVCREDALVCVVHRDPESKETSFVASFEVSEISTQREMMTGNVCVTPHPSMNGNTASPWPEFLIAADNPVEIIGGVQFVHGISGGAATGNWSATDLYRTFRKQECFELSVTETGTSQDISDPSPKTRRTAQHDKLRQTMFEILHSFRFIN